MKPQGNIDNQEINQEDGQTSSSVVQNAAPQPFAFLQPFGEEAIGVCDVEGNCS